MKKLLQTKLYVLAKLILKKYKPKIIAITGSMGKTGAKEAIFAVLEEKYNIRKSDKNYNNEIGVPLTIIGADSGGKSPIKWAKVFLKATKLILTKDEDFPEILVLEMGADKPGDIGHLVKLAPPDIGVLTGIATVHLEFFGSIKKIIQEKEKIVTNIKNNGWAIINCDNEHVNNLKEKIKSEIICYGFGENASLSAVEESINYSNEKIKGMNFKISYHGSVVPVFLPNVVGSQQIYAALAGAAVGTSLGMNLAEVAKGLRNYNSPKGRMRLLDGIKNTLIIDDTYNSSPVASKAALRVLGNIELKNKENKKFAVLGDMLELGSISEEAHLEAGREVAKNKIDVLLAVGEKARDIAQGSLRSGMASEAIFNFATSQEAGRFLQDRLYQGDMVLVKGSQGVRMEKIVKEVMAEPLRAKELLVRQDWKD